MATETVVLPPASQNTSRAITLVCPTLGTSHIDLLRVEPSAGDFLQGQPYHVNLSPGDSMTVVSNGVGWFIMNNFKWSLRDAT